MIHMGFTYPALGGGYGWICRCGEQGDPEPDRYLARLAGDKHLAAANADEQQARKQQEEVSREASA